MKLATTGTIAPIQNAWEAPRRKAMPLTGTATVIKKTIDLRSSCPVSERKVPVAIQTEIMAIAMKIVSKRIRGIAVSFDFVTDAESSLYVAWDATFGFIDVPLTDNQGRAKFDPPQRDSTRSKNTLPIRSDVFSCVLCASALFETAKNTAGSQGTQRRIYPSLRTDSRHGSGDVGFAAKPRHGGA
jgi:hypothetical protein